MRLTDEEIYPIWEKYHGTGEEQHELVKAQHKADVEWLEEPCPHGVPDFESYYIRGDGTMIGEPTTQCYRRACDQCWQEFKEGVKTLEPTTS